MGLCKCPKKKVTNQFCFEHRVNVCEHCIVADHTKCVVQSYLQWLNDSEYDPKCALCQDPLDTQECTRLVCFDVFHSSCLQQWGMSHPPHTAPAGYRCPVCQSSVFPAPQLASPVALALKQTLASWPWARKTMGISTASAGDAPGEQWGSNGAVASDHRSASPHHAGNQSTSKGQTSNESSVATHTFNSKQGGNNSTFSHSNTNGTAITTPSNSAAQPSSSSSAQRNPGDGISDADAAVSGGLTDSGGSGHSPMYRKGSSSDSHSLNVLDDTDDNKYKRRSAITWFRRWWRSYQPLGSTSGRGGLGRRRMLGLLLVLLAATVLLLLARARAAAGDNNDPMLDPLNNPNIHVQDSI